MHSIHTLSSRYTMYYYFHFHCRFPHHLLDLVQYAPLSCNGTLLLRICSFVHLRTPLMILLSCSWKLIAVWNVLSTVSANERCRNRVFWKVIQFAVSYLNPWLLTQFHTFHYFHFSTFVAFLHRLRSRGASDYGDVRILAKCSALPVFITDQRWSNS